MYETSIVLGLIDTRGEVCSRSLCCLGAIVGGFRGGRLSADGWLAFGLGGLACGLAMKMVAGGAISKWALVFD